MLPSLNYDSKDPKYTLLAEIFNIIDSKKARNILSRNGVNNRQMMVYSIKYFLWPCILIIMCLMLLKS